MSKRVYLSSSILASHRSAWFNQLLSDSNRRHGQGLGWKGCPGRESPSSITPDLFAIDLEECIERFRQAYTQANPEIFSKSLLDRFAFVETHHACRTHVGILLFVLGIQVMGRYRCQPSDSAPQGA